MNLNDLNKDQREAAETLEGPLLVLAGAGSGKTKMLTYRIANLIAHGVAPWHIMAITFTNKAAAEMRERVVQLVGEDGNQVWVSTFHSACARILRRDIEKLGYKRTFVIYDDSDQETLLKDIIKRLNLDKDEYPLRDAKAIIGHAKEKLLTPQEWLTESERSYKDQTYFEIYKKYEERLKENNALDFNDLILRTLELFTMHPPVLQYYHHTLRYFHVDEYQDTDYAQYMLIRLLASEERNLCVVGDDDQSIYSWRGADIRNIRNFKKDFPEAKIVKLERNYRSSANILDAANQVIAGNTDRMDKALWTEREAGEKISYYEGQNESDEAGWIAGEIQRLRNAGSKYSDVTILYRMNYQSRLIELALGKLGVPYRMYGGLKFYDRKEIKDISAYLRLLLNPTDDVSFQRIINVPKRGLGEASVGALMDYAASEGIPAMSACMSLPEDFNKRAKKKFEDFADLIMRLTIEMSMRKPADFVKYMIDETHIRDDYKGDDSEEAQSKIENINQYENAVSEFMENDPEKTLLDFLETTSLESSFDAIDQSAGAVTLMTLHGAKGLEFPIVFMAGMDQGIFPTFRAIFENDNVEEERRLCYVGITRAENKLYLTRAARRFRNGNWEDYESSEFIDDIPTRLITCEDGMSSFGGFGQSFGGSSQRNFNEPLTFENGTQWKTTMRQGTMGRASGFGSGNTVNLGGKTIPGVQRGVGTTGPRAAAPQGQTRVSSAAAGTGTNTQYAIGDQVMHKTFGPGRVMEVRNASDGRRLVVRFNGGMVKELMADMAPIIKMEG